MNNRKGFTLIEMIMVIMLIGIVAAIIAIPLSQGVKGWFQATSREGISQSGRIAIERMAREIRNTARKADNTPCISTADVSSFIFSDATGDLTNCTTFNFSKTGAFIQRNADNLADNVTSLDINYYNSSNGIIPKPVIAGDLPTIRRISIEIVGTQGGETVRKYSEVYLSNMKGY